MASLSDSPENEQLAKKLFASYAILDFETSNLPEDNFNKVGITELSIYGVGVEELENVKRVQGTNVPVRPRVLHKLTLMINPMMRILPEAERITGLDNFMLENESKFNENTANTLLGFLKHLKAPVCLVAHNGWRFDFPILKYVMERIKINMSSDLYCLDSIRAFHDIDQCRTLQVSDKTVSNLLDCELEPSKLKDCELETVTKAGQNFDARARNETTPKRPILKNENIGVRRKRRLSSDSETDEESLESKNTISENRPPKSRRHLNFDDSNANTSLRRSLPKKPWYPPKGVYTLPSIYKRVFEKEPSKSHYAEADVFALMQLMQHYGSDFVDYSNLQAIPFECIPKIGMKNDL